MFYYNYSREDLIFLTIYVFETDGILSMFQKVANESNSERRLKETYGFGEEDFPIDYSDLKLTAFQLEMTNEFTALSSIFLQIDPMILFYLGIKTLYNWQRKTKKLVCEIDFMKPVERKETFIQFTGIYSELLMNSITNLEKSDVDQAMQNIVNFYVSTLQNRPQELYLGSQAIRKPI
jgi:hypothetical protein